MAAFAGEQGTVTSDRLDVFLLAHLPTGVPGPHLGCLGGSRERPCISWLIVRGLGTGLGALDFLHQMAKPPMSLEQGAGTGGNQCSEKPGLAARACISVWPPFGVFFFPKRYLTPTSVLTLGP